MYATYKRLATLMPAIDGRSTCSQGMPFSFFSLHQNAVSRQCARMQWEVFDWNVKALRFYDGIGGKCTPEWLKIEMNRTALTAFASDIKN